jgi:hypothetical protein
MYLHRNIRQLFLLILFSALSVSFQSESYTYSNPYVGLSFVIPVNWHVLSENDAINYRNSGKSLSPSYSEGSGLLLLATSENKEKAKHSEANRNINIFAFNARKSSKELTSGEEFLKSSEEEFRQSTPNISASPINDYKFGAEDFKRLYLTNNNSKLYMVQLAKIHNDYLIVFTLSANSNEILNDLLKSCDKNLKLFSVSYEVDSSEEGIVLRKKATLVKQQSSFSLKSLTSTTQGKLVVIVLFFAIINGLFKGLKQLFPRFFKSN